MRADSARAVTLGSFWDGFMMSPSNVSSSGIPPDNLYEYQKKRLTKFAFRKCVILKGMSFASKTGNNSVEKEKRDQGPALQTQYFLHFLKLLEGKRSTPILRNERRRSKSN